MNNSVLPSGLPPVGFAFDSTTTALPFNAGTGCSYTSGGAPAEYGSRGGTAFSKFLRLQLPTSRDPSPLPPAVSLSVSKTTSLAPPLRCPPPLVVPVPPLLTWV